MNCYWLLILTTACVVHSSKENCEVVTQEDCETLTSEYEKYRECMEHRHKRSLDCAYASYEDESCDDCDCSICENISCSSCNTNCCSNCCPTSSCQSYGCCHQTCRAECRSNACRTSCKKQCKERSKQKTVTIDRIRENERESKLSVNVTNQGTKTNHNITTVIHLNNIVNNTNLINLPISITNKAINNITNEAYGGSNTGGQNCCQTIGPRQCVPQKEYPFARCFHIRKKTCGNICTAPVMHYQKHEVCDNDVNLQQPCKQQIVFVPQPQPRCAYRETWPYVTCQGATQETCEGCYDHYIKREDVKKCSSFCYDDGYGIGPYYRQGPYYRPGYAHAPSCLQTGTCNDFGNLDSYSNLPISAGFPSMYPQGSYPFIIEDNCENCTMDMTHYSTDIGNPIMKLNNDESMQHIQFDNVSDMLMNIDAKVYPTRPERYAEISIKTDVDSDHETMTEQSD